MVNIVTPAGMVVDIEKVIVQGYRCNKCASMKLRPLAFVRGENNSAFLVECIECYDLTPFVFTKKQLSTPDVIINIVENVGDLNKQIREEPSHGTCSKCEVGSYQSIDKSICNRMAQEMQEARFASLQPILVMGRTIAYGVIKDVRQIAEQTTIGDRTFLYNVGSGPALNLRFYLKEPNRKTPSGTFGNKELRALSPDEGYELNIENTFGQKRLSSHDLVVEYEDVFGRKWCSGLELNYTQGQKELTVLKLFYEKLD